MECSKKTDLDWDTWSKSKKPVPKYRQYQYRDIENILKSLGQDIDKISKDLDIDPRAYIQMNSPQFRKNGYFSNVYYKGTPISDASHFPKPTDPDYIPAKGRRTGNEGIYFGDRNNYTLERYTKPEIGLREYGVKPTGRIHKIAVKGNFANLGDIPLENKRPDLFYEMYTKDRRDIEKFGYDFIENSHNSIQGNRRNEWLVFEPNQIKSLEGNIGTFDPNSKYIYIALGGPLYNQNNPIESFQGNPYIPIVRY